MRVLILIHGYPPDQTGGAERRAARTAVRLRRRGNDVMVLAISAVVDPPGTSESADVIDNGVLVRRLSLLADRSPGAFRTAYDNPQTERATRRAIAEFAPDVVHLFSGYLMSASAPGAAIESGIPVVVSLTDYWWLCHRITLIRSDGQRCDGPSIAGCARCHAEAMRRFRVPAVQTPRLVERVWRSSERYGWLQDALGFAEQERRREVLLDVLNRCTALISPSQYLADFYARNGVDRQRIRVSRQGVDIDRCRLRQSCDTVRFGCLGQVKSHKGIDLLLEAWERVNGDRPRHLSIFGSSEGEHAFGRKVRSFVARRADVSWPGEYRGDEVWDVLNALDVLVVPSRWVENSPNSILEAQAVGVPVIAANLGAMPELVLHGQNGLLFDVDDVDSLRTQLQRLVDDPALIGEMRSRAIPFKTVDDELDELVCVYSGLLNARSSHVSLAAL